LKAEIEAVHQEHPAYGHRRIAWHLRINHKRSQRVMSLYHLRPPRRTSRQYSTRSRTKHPYVNLLKSIDKISQPHQVWCSDLSRFVYRGTIWYLASIVDIATRQIITYRIGKRHDSQFVLASLQTALASERKPSIFHSDQGNEFMAQRCTEYLEKHQIQVSVSDVASPCRMAFRNPFSDVSNRSLATLIALIRWESYSKRYTIIFITTTTSVFIRPSRCRQRFLLSGHFQNYVFNNWVLDNNNGNYLKTIDAEREAKTHQLAWIGLAKLHPGVSDLSFPGTLALDLSEKLDRYRDAIKDGKIPEYAFKDTGGCPPKP
jgi:transposase InsO family protein